MFSLLVAGVSLATGYRASRAAGVPQYLFTKTRVLVETVPPPADETEAEIEAALAESGEPPRTVVEFRPMFVLGALDGALPMVIVGGIAALIWTLCRRRTRAGA